MGPGSCFHIIEGSVLIPGCTFLGLLGSGFVKTSNSFYYISKVTKPAYFMGCFTLPLSKRFRVSSLNWGSYSCFFFWTVARLAARKQTRSQKQRSKHTVCLFLVASISETLST